MPLTPDEIDDLKSMLKVARKRDINFGLCLENDVAESVLLLHRKKPPSLLLRRAKALGSSPKFTMGRMRMKGKVVTLDCDIDAPPNCARQLRLFLREIGTAVKVEVTDPNGHQDGALKADKTPPPAAKAAGPYKKTQALWAMTRTKMDKEMSRLQSAIIDVCSKDPDLRALVAEAEELDDRLDVFDGELDMRLADLVGEAEGSSLDAAKAQARATVQEYETALNDPFFADLDTKNGFLNVAIASTAKQSLAAISKVLR